MARGGVIESSHRFRGPCSACGDGDTAMKYHDHKPQPSRYTVDEITKLAKQFAHEGKIDNMEGALAIGIFLAWLAKREQGKGGDGVR